MPNWLLILFNFFIFVFIFIFSFILVKILIENKIIHKSLKAFYKHIKNNERTRIENEERLRLEDGKRERVKFLTKVDILLFRSGLSIIFPFISTETYLIGTVILVVFVFMLLNIFAGTLFAIIGVLSMVTVAYLILYFLSGYNYKKTEKTIMNLANLLENYSKTTDDIINIFQKVLPYTENPVKTALEECCMTALTTGQVSLSLYQLSNKIEHEKFKELIRNLEICSRYEANYAEIIMESKRNLREYIAAKEQRKEMRHNSKVDIILLLLAGGVILKVVEQLGEGSIMSVLTGSMAGNIILLYCAGIMLAIIYLFCSIDR